MMCSAYGSTEVNALLWGTHPCQSKETQMNTIGRFTTTPGFKYRIVDDNGHDCKQGMPGEIVVYSPTGMINYLKDKGKPPVKWVGPDRKRPNPVSRRFSIPILSIPKFFLSHFQPWSRLRNVFQFYVSVSVW